MITQTDNADRLRVVSADELRAEVDRLRDENADLRASAIRWKQLYEAAVGRAERAAEAQWQN